MRLPSSAAALLLAASPRLLPRSPAPRLSLPATPPDTFELSVNLGEAHGTVDITLQPYFSESELVTLRVPLPFELHAEPVQGVYKVVEAGYGLLEGDVLRAFSSLTMRYDSTAKSTKIGPGLPGRRAVEAMGQNTDWTTALSGSYFGGATVPQKCLFVADGMAHTQVTDALVANEPAKVDNEIVMVFERPVQARR